MQKLSVAVRILVVLCATALSVVAQKFSPISIPKPMPIPVQPLYSALDIRPKFANGAQFFNITYPQTAVVGAQAYANVTLTQKNGVAIASVVGSDGVTATISSDGKSSLGREIGFPGAGETTRIVTLNKTLYLQLTFVNTGPIPVFQEIVTSSAGASTTVAYPGPMPYGNVGYTMLISAAGDMQIEPAVDLEKPIGPPPVHVD